MASRTAKSGVPGVGEIPPPLELACLTILWKRGEADVGEVREALRESRPLAYTTVMTVLERLSRKGMVTRQKSGRSFRYTPARDREEMRSVAIARLVEQFFDGSFSQFRRYLLAMSADGSAPAPAESRETKLPPLALEAGEGTSLQPAPSSSTLDETLL